MRSTAGALFELVDQRLDLAAVAGDVGIEVRTAGHHHAHALDLHVGDAQALARIADLPLDGHRLAVALVELAGDHRDVVGPVGDAGNGQGLTAVLAEALAVGAGLGADHGLEEAFALFGVG